MKRVFKIVCALTAAAVAPATAFTIPYLLDRFEVYHGNDIHYAYESAASMWILAFIIALAHAVVFGLPAYFWVQKRGLIRWWIGVLCGFIIGCIPMAIITWPLSLFMRGTASFDGVTTIVNGIPTYAGWISYMEGSA